MSAMFKCDRCGDVISPDEHELRSMPIGIGGTAEAKDLCKHCWQEFQHWWTNVIRVGP